MANVVRAPRRERGAGGKAQQLPGGRIWPARQSRARAALAAQAEKLSTPMTVPIPLPPERRAAGNHCTVQIDAAAGRAPRGCPVAAAAAVPETSERRAADKDVSVLTAADRSADEAHQVVSRFLGGCIWTGLVAPTRAVGFSSGDAGEAAARAFGAPDRAAAIPDVRGGADSVHSTFSPADVILLHP